MAARPGHVSRDALIAPGSALYRRFGDELTLGGLFAPVEGEEGEEAQQAAQLTWPDLWDAR